MGGMGFLLQESDYEELMMGQEMKNLRHGVVFPKLWDLEQFEALLVGGWQGIWGMAQGHVVSGNFSVP